MPSAAVVGAGLSGLTAGHRLRCAGWDVTVLESEADVGGRVRTVRRDGYVVDIGATALSGAYTSYIALAEELGLQVRPGSQWFGIHREGRTRLLRADRKVLSGLRTDLLSLGSKLRLARLGADVLRARRRGQLDYADMRKAAPLDTETAHAYAHRALNDEIATYLCDPIVRVMLIADADKISKVELFSGISNIFAASFFALRGGQGRMTEVLAEGLDVRTSCPVVRVAGDGEGVEVVHQEAGDEHAERYDACVVTCPLPIAAAICPDQNALLAPLAESLSYTAGITVAVGTARAPDSPAFLVQMPSREDPDVALMFLDHNKADDRAPAGHGLIGCCWETDAAARMLGASDDAIIERTLTSVYRVFPELRDTVDFTHVTRWPRALPRTAIGAYRRIGDFNAALDPRSRIQFAADYMSAAGQNTAVEFGTRAADNLQALAIG